MKGPVPVMDSLTGSIDPLQTAGFIMIHWIL